MEADLGNLFSIAALALLGTLIARRFRLSLRLIGLVPLALSVIIVWVSGDALPIADVLVQGIAGGLLAAGIFYIYLELTGRLR